MRMNKKNHTADAKRPVNKKKGGSSKHTAKNDFRQNPFVNLKEDPGRSVAGDNRAEHARREEAEQIAEMIGCVLEEILGGNGDVSMRPMVGVIELNPEDGLSMEVRDLNDQREKYRREFAGKGNELADLIRGQKESVPSMPPCDGCGEEIFQEMLADLNRMQKMVLEADHMMRMVCLKDVDPEDARCVTYLSLRDAADIMKKWDKYRRCDI